MEQIKKHWIYAVLLFALSYIFRDQFLNWERKRFEIKQEEVLKANGLQKVSCESIQPIASVPENFEQIIEAKAPLKANKKKSFRNNKTKVIYKNDTTKTAKDYLNQRRFDAKGREMFYNVKTKTWI